MIYDAYFHRGPTANPTGQLGDCKQDTHPNRVGAWRALNDLATDTGSFALDTSINLGGPWVPPVPRINRYETRVRRSRRLRQRLSESKWVEFATHGWPVDDCYRQHGKLGCTVKQAREVVEELNDDDVGHFLHRRRTRTMTMGRLHWL